MHSDRALVFMAELPWWAIVLLALVSAAILFLTWRSYGRLKLRRRLALTALRLFAVAVAVMLILRPAVRDREVTYSKSSVVVLADASASMAVADEKDGPTRMERLRKWIQKSRGVFDSFRRNHKVTAAAFAKQLKPFGALESLDSLAADGTATRILRALEGVGSRVPPSELGAIIIVSDGADNGYLGRRLGLVNAKKADLLGKSTDKFLKGLGVPISVVPMGNPDKFRDLAVVRFAADPFAFVRNTIEVEAELLVSGYAGLKVPVLLKRAGAIISSRTVTLVKGKHRYRVGFKFVPDQIGTFHYTIEVPRQPEEVITNNNVQAFILKVIRDRIRVLQVAGRPTWDVRYLRRYLKKKPNVDLISFFILRTPTSMQLVPNHELSLIPFPTYELFSKELNSFDLVIFQNFNFRPYALAYLLENISRYVLKHGGGFAMLGGDLSFSAGEYANTPVAAILPIRLMGHQGPHQGGGSYMPTLTSAGRTHPITRLASSPGETARLWGTLPKLEGINLSPGSKSDAVVLMTHPTLKLSGQPLPVLAVAEAGRGRVMALTTDSSWLWYFADVGAGGDGRHYHTFWNNAIRWLIKDPELKRIRLSVKQELIPPGKPIPIKVKVYDRSYSPVKDATVTIVVTPINNAAKKRQWTGKTAGDGLARWDCPAFDKPLEAKVSATGWIDTREIGTDRAVLRVGQEAAERADVRPEPVLLSKIAAITGGRVLDPGKALPRDLPRRKPRIIRVDRLDFFNLWDHIVVLLLAILFLGAEWWFRRRWGYI